MATRADGTPRCRSPWDASDSRFEFRTDFSVDHMNGTLIKDQQNVTLAASGDITVMNGGIGTYTSFTPIVVGLTWF